MEGVIYIVKYKYRGRSSFPHPHSSPTFDFLFLSSTIELSCFSTHTPASPIPQSSSPHHPIIDIPTPPALDHCNFCSKFRIILKSQSRNLLNIWIHPQVVSRSDGLNFLWLRAPIDHFYQSGSGFRVFPLILWQLSGFHVLLLIVDCDEDRGAGWCRGEYYREQSQQ